MLAGLGNRVAELRLAELRRDQRAALRTAHDVGRAYVRLLVHPEGHDPPRMRPRRRDQPVAVRVVVGDDRDAARLQPLENLAFGVGDLGVAGEIFAVSRAMVVTMATWAGPAGQRGKLTFVLIPISNTPNFASRGSGEAQRHAGMIVVVLTGGAPARRRALKRREERSLVPVSPPSPSRDDPALVARTRSSAQLVQGFGRVATERAALRPYGLRGPWCQSTAARAFSTNKCRLSPPLHCDEQVARADLARIEARRQPRNAMGGATHGSAIRRGSKRAHVASSRATATSSKGSTLVPTIWACSWPCRPRDTMSPGPASGSPRGSPRAGPAPPPLPALRQDRAPDRGPRPRFGDCRR